MTYRFLPPMTWFVLLSALKGLISDKSGTFAKSNRKEYEELS